MQKILSCLLIAWYCLTSCSKRDGRVSQITLHGFVLSGEIYRKRFSRYLEFSLIPTHDGWHMSVSCRGRVISYLTPPLHGPNPCEIDGVNLSNSQSSGPTTGDLNAWGYERPIVFSPAVGTSIQGPEFHTAPTPEDIALVSNWGRGLLTIEQVHMNYNTPDQRAQITFMKFTVHLIWTNDEL